MSERMISDELAVELFRLRYALRRATETRLMGPEAQQALCRMLELAHHGGPGHLFFEHRRWQVQLEGLHLA
jgi:hypothetical protein